jgi:hypothetical protein
MARHLDQRLDETRQEWLFSFATLGENEYVAPTGYRSPSAKRQAERPNKLHDPLMEPQMLSRIIEAQTLLHFIPVSRVS